MEDLEATSTPQTLTVNGYGVEFANNITKEMVSCVEYIINDENLEQAVEVTSTIQEVTWIDIYTIQIKVSLATNKTRPNVSVGVITISEQGIVDNVEQTAIVLINS